ncbi:glycosyltransferase [Parasediminibacterium sp. JCM 36343]|uniref:glycosyltransferase n=1 Tax=Parasediminibacterium sp. JCM 36343 TaxID=3374279 RepID=UPI00397B4AD6
MLNIILPLYNDWESLDILLKKIKAVESKENIGVCNIFVVNDSSSIPYKSDKSIFNGSCRTINLNKNIGHQKSIAVGLSYLLKTGIRGDVIIMDSDGEDMPEDIIKLVAAAKEESGKIIFAKRKKRNESLGFILFYNIYKLIFKLFTGKEIGFGNFCFVPASKLDKIVHLHEIWNHFSGGIMKSKLPFAEIPIDRGTRYAGKSKMNFNALVIHGLSAISVHIEAVLIRIIIFSVSAITMLLLVILASVAMKLFLHITSPGWATTVIIGSLIIIFQLFLTTLLFSFQVLNNRSLRLVLPIKDYADFIESVEEA